MMIYFRSSILRLPKKCYNTPMLLDDIIAKQGDRKPEILADKCKGCTVCIKKCPTAAITGERKEPHRIDTERCNHCGECASVCKFNAIVGLTPPQPPPKREDYAHQMIDILDRLCEGKSTPEDFAVLEAVERRVRVESTCRQGGLGKVELSPVLSTLRFFRSECEAYVRGERPAQVTYQISEHCNGCSICTRHCPVSAIPATPYRRHSIDASVCAKCDVCRQNCPRGAIVVV